MDARIKTKWRDHKGGCTYWPGDVATGTAGNRAVAAGVGAKVRGAGPKNLRRRAAKDLANKAKSKPKNK